MWEFVYSMLTDPSRLRLGLERVGEEARGELSLDPEREIRRLKEDISEAARLRRAYQDQQAAGLMTLGELRACIAEAEGTRAAAEARLAALRRSRERADRLEEESDAVLTDLAERIPEDLAGLTGDERNALYRMLRLEVTPGEEELEVTGVLLTPETHSCG